MHGQYQYIKVLFTPAMGTNVYRAILVYTYMNNLIMNPRLVPRSWLAGLLELEPGSVDVYDEDLYDDQEYYEAEIDPEW